MKNILIGSCVLLVAGSLLAKEKHQAPTVRGGAYGMAGCGLGAIVVDRDEFLPQIGAWLLNGIYSNQTYAISSGTSNCVEGRSEVAAMEQEVYFAANLNSITKEAAQGSGEHLDGVARVLGCDQDADKSRLNELGQAHYAQIFSERAPDAVLQSYLSVVNADPQLAKSCGKAS
ncbi:MAG: DUF3015 domain-containing protein [Proteobacteria bacterium]|nr:MAG: DUF3015 domain-containing protein [Pseudomonadota bacterium]